MSKTNEYPECTDYHRIRLAERFQIPDGEITCTGDDDYWFRKNIVYVESHNGTRDVYGCSNYSWFPIGDLKTLVMEGQELIKTMDKDQQREKSARKLNWLMIKL